MDFYTVDRIEGKTMLVSLDGSTKIPFGTDEEKEYAKEFLHKVELQKIKEKENGHN